MDAITTTQQTQLQTVTAELLIRYTNQLDASDKTRQTYGRALKRFMTWLSMQGIQSPTKADIVAYRDDLKLTHKPTTVQTYIVALRSFFSWTADEGLYPDVTAKVKGVKLTREHRKDALTTAQVKQVLEYARQDTSITGKRNYAMLLLMLTGGLRTIEVVRANTDDLRNVGSCEVLYLQGKGRDDKTEYVKIIPQVSAALHDYIACRGTAAAPLFTSTSNNSKGERLTTRSVSRVIKTMFRACGLDSDRLTAHSTRHTAVTLALLSGQSLDKVQQFARHSNINTTLIYAHHLERAANNTENAIGEMIL